MSIRLIYRVEVEIPDAIFQAHGHTPEYDHAVLRATEGAESGSDYYAQVYEWAETDSLPKAQAIEARLARVARGDFS